MDLKPIQPAINSDKLYRLMGSRPGRDIPEAMIRRVRRQTKIISDLLSPWHMYEKRKILEIGGGAVRIEGLPTLKSRRMAATLRDCTHAVLFLATIGSDITDAVNELTARDQIADAYILDAIGSVAVEDLVEQFHLRMERECLAAGRSVTVRFSPGYCDWDITEQRKIFPAFEGKKSRVELSLSCLMDPRKSVSGLFGILPFDNGRPVSKHIPCRVCNKTDCIARRS
jgi:hypothetical protein